MTEEKEYGNKFVGKLVSTLIILPTVYLLWPTVIPFGFSEFGEVKGTLGQWLYVSIPLFAWAIIINIGKLTVNGWEVPSWVSSDNSVGIILFRSVVPGVTEEVLFRWLFFLSGIVGVKITNFLLFGFLGFGIPEWFHMNIVGPVVNWATLGALEGYIFHASGWAVGAAMISINGFFRDGHKYQGVVGWINSWFVGMFLFWLMFQYGLLAAIIAHTLSNAFAGTTVLTASTLFHKQQART